MVVHPGAEKDGGWLCMAADAPCVRSSFRKGITVGIEGSIVAQRVDQDDHYSARDGGAQNLTRRRAVYSPAESGKTGLSPSD